MKNNVKESLHEFIKNQSTTLRKKIRAKAVSKAKSNLTYYGKSADDISDEDWEHLVAEEEDKIWQVIKSGGIAALAASMGIIWF